MAEKWIGKIAVVTGASAGIGASIFKDFAKAGIITIGLARRVEKVEEIIKKLGAVKAHALQCDVSDPKSVLATFKMIESKFKFVNILVNNAGVGRNINIFDEGEDTFKKMQEILNTNVAGLTLCSMEAVKLMKKSNDYGMIININSVVGHSTPFVGHSMHMYAASKHAVTSLCESMRQELILQKNDKIRVTSLSPGYVTTEIITASGYSTEHMKAFEDFPAIASDDISQAALYLLSTPYNVNVTELTIRPVGEKF